MIQATNLYKSYGDLPILKGVSLKIKPNEVVSIVGASGAGKTTLLQLLGTLDRPTAPKDNHTEILIDGENVALLSDKALSRFRNQQLGFIFQFHQLLPELSAKENAMLPALIGKEAKKEASNRALELLTFLGLKNRTNHNPNQLSGGEQQRVAIARALVNQPKVVFADEPSGNLDSKNAEELHALFFQLREEFGQTFVIVTHNTDLANMADRTLVMNDGNIVSHEKTHATHL